MAPLLGDSLDRIRRLVNDQLTYPDGEARPDTKYSDRDIVSEIGRALIELLHKKPGAYYPEVTDADERIVEATTLTADAVSLSERERKLPIGMAYLPGIEARVVATLESTDQEGVRPETGQQLTQVTEGPPA